MASHIMLLLLKDNIIANIVKELIKSIFHSSYSNKNEFRRTTIVVE